MGREITNENAVIAESSMFMISSFLAFSANISSRVMSRDSIDERSSRLFFLPTPKAMVAVRWESAPGVKNASAVDTIAVAAARAQIKAAKRDMITRCYDYFTNNSENQNEKEFDEARTMIMATFCPWLSACRRDAELDEMTPTTRQEPQSARRASGEMFQHNRVPWYTEMTYVVRQYVCSLCTGIVVSNHTLDKTVVVLCICPV